MKQFIFATLAMLALCFNAGATEYHGTFVGNLIPPMTTTITSSNGSMSFSQSINPVGGVNYDLNVRSVNFSSQFTTNSGQVTIQSLAASLITGLAATIGAQVQGSNYLTSSSNIAASQIISPPWLTNNPMLTNQIYSTNIVSNGNSTGANNRFMGQNSGNNTMTGSDNTGLGLNTLIGDTTGSDNTAIGFAALINNKTGIDNTVMGSGAMASNTNGSYNIAIGFNAMYNSLSAAGNVAIGNSSLINTSGNNNMAIGDNSMTACTTGSYNSGSGFGSFPNLLTGQYNVAFGIGAGVNITNGNYNIDIGASGTLDETGIIRIGTTGTQTATYLTGIVYGNGSGITNIPLTGLTNNSANSGQVLYVTPTGAINTEISSGVSGVQTNWTNIWTGTNTFTNMVNMTNETVSGVFTLAPGATFSAPSASLSVGSISANSGSINGSAIVNASGLAATIGAQVQGSNYLTSSSNISAGQITSPPWQTGSTILTNITSLGMGSTPGVLTNNGSGTLNWVPVAGGGSPALFNTNQFTGIGGTTNITSGVLLTNADLSGTQTNNQAWTTNGIGTNYFGWWTNYNGVSSKTNIYPWGTNTVGLLGETNIFTGTFGNPNSTNWVTSGGTSWTGGSLLAGVYPITNTFGTNGLSMISGSGTGTGTSLYYIGSGCYLNGNLTMGSGSLIVTGAIITPSEVFLDGNYNAGIKEISTGTLLLQTNGYFQGICGSTNGFASWSTNLLAPGYAAGWTNLGTVGGITNRMYANIIGTSGSIVYWGRTGANGVTPCGFPIFTNTVSAVGQVIPVGVNCGIQINSGVGVTITPYSQGE